MRSPSRQHLVPLRDRGFFEAAANALIIPYTLPLMNAEHKHLW
jgi:hypothetical protein